MVHFAVHDLLDQSARGCGHHRGERNCSEQAAGLVAHGDHGDVRVRDRRPREFPGSSLCHSVALNLFQRIFPGGAGSENGWRRNHKTASRFRRITQQIRDEGPLLLRQALHEARRDLRRDLIQQLRLVIGSQEIQQASGLLIKQGLEKLGLRGRIHQFEDAQRPVLGQQAICHGHISGRKPVDFLRNDHCGVSCQPLLDVLCTLRAHHSL